MKQRTKQTLGMILLIVGMFVTLMIVVSLMSALFEHGEFSKLNHKGYKVKFENFQCKIKVQNQDNSFDWVWCRNVGNEYSLENFAVRRSR